MTQIQVSAHDACKFLGVAKATLKKLVEEGKLPATNTGSKDRKYYKFTMKDLRAYKAEHPPRPRKRGHAATNGQGTVQPVYVGEVYAGTMKPVKASPVGMLTQILTELKQLREEVAELRRMWS